MNTKIFFKALLALVMMTTSFMAVAESSEAPKNSPSSGRGSIVLNSQYKYPNGKRLPSRNFLQLSYSDGLLSLASYTYEGEFTIQLDNVETGDSVVVPSIFVGESINIELACGFYNVSVTGVDNLSFYGCLEISEITE